MLKEANPVTRFVLPGVPAGGIRTVGQIRGTNTLILHAGPNGMVVALELLTTHTSGAPVVDDRNEFIGFINEFDVLRALEAGKDLSELTAEDIMVHDRGSHEDDEGEALAKFSREAEGEGGLLRDTPRPPASPDRPRHFGRRLTRDTRSGVGQIGIGKCCIHVKGGL